LQDGERILTAVAIR